MFNSFKIQLGGGLVAVVLKRVIAPNSILYIKFNSQATIELRIYNKNLIKKKKIIIFF